MDQIFTESTRWRWVFYINLPISLVAVTALVIFLPANLSVRTSVWNGWETVRHSDFLGAMLWAATTICLMLGLTWGGEQVASSGMRFGPSLPLPRQLP